MGNSFVIVHKEDTMAEAFSHVTKDKLLQSGWTYDERNPQIVVSIGGDGTMLDAFQGYTRILDKVTFVGLNKGHLGFYADWQENELDEFIKALISEEGEVVSYPIIEVELKGRTYYVLNELTVKQMGSTFIGQIYLNETLFEEFRGDGLCISTPTGSTAYNKGLGGAVLHPTIECMQLAEMVPINNNEYRTLCSPIILPKHHTIKISFENDANNAYICIDRMTLDRLDKDVTIRCRISDKKVSFLRHRKYPFWNRVKSAFL